MGNHQKLLESCRALREYMLYVECVRKYAAQPDMTLDAAVCRAVDECIKQNILADFLKKSRAEVSGLDEKEIRKLEKQKILSEEKI